VVSIPADSDQGSERSDAGELIVEEVMGIVKRDLRSGSEGRQLQRSTWIQKIVEMFSGILKTSCTYSEIA